MYPYLQSAYDEEGENGIAQDKSANYDDDTDGNYSMSESENGYANVEEDMWDMDADEGDDMGGW